MKNILSIGALTVAFGLVAGVESTRAADGFRLKPVADGFVSPTVLTPLPGQKGVLVVADQAGTAHVIGADGKLSETLFLDVRSKLVKLNPGFDERGLLGLAFHPKFTENRKFYVAYSVPLRAGGTADFSHTQRLSEFRVEESNPAKAIPDSERVLLENDHPYFNHDGGTLAFGPDGYLYLAMGDGGNANDDGKRPATGNAQNLDTLLGKILRIDVNQGNPYAIPSDNPLVGKQGRPEIYAWGFRNPWRISFDRGGNRELFAADVGQDAYEEVDIVVKGGNYGWRIREGRQCFDVKAPTVAPADCPKTGANGEPLLDPIIEYKNSKAHRRDGLGISITGGYVYRGKALPQWQGKYIFADWSKNWAVPMGVFFAATRGENGQLWSLQPIAPTEPKPFSTYIVGFGEDEDGELYVLSNNSNQVTGKSGKVWKIIPN